MPPLSQAPQPAAPVVGLADPHAAREAVEMALPLMERAIQDVRVGQSGFLYIVVMNPLACPQQHAFEAAILYEHALGDQGAWDADYAGFARAKALVHWRTGMDSHAVQTRAPHLLAPGDTTLWGSAELDGIVVAVSGANAWYDEAFAGIVAHCLRAVARGRKAASDALFLPG
ncbi:hypothetical protein FOZ76_18080 [Verticiella sediminum]|uniref:Uncharacterized protein n=1 Tax=Verticiella sediminum TaxID=1247510 RepID=A0A556AFF0_9BURK|nr:hypothetical protein [Verticiella sediminum]TSH91611.1 hypothetical protein FOZ76_18080 [Verticiella sediminum]